MSTFIKTFTDESLKIDDKVNKYAVENNLIILSASISKMTRGYSTVCVVFKRNTVHEH